MSDETTGVASEQRMLRQQISESRGALADKLELLEEKVTESVGTATASVVETVQQATASVSDTVGCVNSAVQDTVENVRNSVFETVRSVKETFDLPEQVRRYPWQTFAGAAVIGFVGSRLLLKPQEYSDGRSLGERESFRRAASDRDREFRVAKGDGAVGFMNSGNPSRYCEEEPRRSLDSQNTGTAGSGWMDQIKDVVKAELGKLQSLAIGTSLGLVRDVISQSVPPALQPHVAEIINDMNRKLGGEPIHDSILSQGGRDEMPSSNTGHREPTYYAANSQDRP